MRIVSVVTVSLFAASIFAGTLPRTQVCDFDGENASKV